MGKTLSTLFGHLEALVDESLRKSAFHLDSEFIEETLRILAEDESANLQNDEVLCEVGPLGHFDFLAKAIALHFGEEGLDDLGDQEVEAGEDGGDEEADQDFFLVGEEEVLEEGVGGVFGAEEAADGSKHLEAGFGEGEF